MRPYKDFVHERRADDPDTRVIPERKEDDLVTGIIVMVVLGLILGSMLGLAI